jgi:hypothetical protein
VAPASPEATAAAVATDAPPTPDQTVEPTPEITPEITPEPVVTPEPIDPDCPQSDVISAQEFVDGKTSCFANGTRVRGWLDGPPPTGFEGPLVKPTWLYYPDGDTATALWHQPPPEPDHVCGFGEECWWFWPHLDPTLDLELEPLERWVILTGHTRDPRAEHCHYEGEAPDPELIAICKRQFVVTAIEEAP